MSAFGDFGPLSERRRAEKEQKRRKHIMMAGGAISVIIIIAAVAAMAVVFVNKNDNTSTSSDSHGKKDSGGATPTKQSAAISTSTKMVDSMCSRTDHKDTCVSSLTKAVNSTSKPKDIVKAAVSVVYDAVGEAFGKTSLHKSDDPLIQGAVEVCDRLLDDSRSDLEDTINKIEISKLEDLPKAGPVLNVWLSAVRSYQETCVDSFPEGEPRDKMKAEMKVVNELTSNALAIVTKVGNFLAALNIPGLSRRLLEAHEEETHVDEEGFPSWVEDDDRRTLRQSATASLNPSVIVAQDGSGQFKTINDALNAMPVKYEGRYVIYVKSGVYDEQVIIDRKKINITMYGDGNLKTIVTGNKNYKAGVQTYMTASFAVEADGFMCLNMGFANTAGPIGEQAVALRVKGDCAVFLNCKIDGFQDTLYAQAKRQFYRNCIITGTVDYMFGDAAAVFQSCVLAVRRPGDNQQNIVTAHGRVDARERTGFVIHNSKIIAADDLAPVQANFKSYLARPWKPFSTTVFMESEIGNLIEPIGYMPWGNTAVGQDTCTYAEYNNRGAGANTAQRAPWKGVNKQLTREQATQYTPSAFVVDIEGWTKKYDVVVPLRLGFFQ